MTDEPTVKGSWPLVQLVEGAPHWHIAGTNPPQYAPDPKLEALWREGQERLYRPRTGVVIQLRLWEQAA